MVSIQLIPQGFLLSSWQDCFSFPMTECHSYKARGGPRPGPSSFPQALHSHMQAVLRAARLRPRRSSPLTWGTCQSRHTVVVPPGSKLKDAHTSGEAAGPERREPPSFPLDPGWRCRDSGVLFWKQASNITFKRQNFICQVPCEGVWSSTAAGMPTSWPHGRPWGGWPSGHPTLSTSSSQLPFLGLPVTPNLQQSVVLFQPLP